MLPLPAQPPSPSIQATADPDAVQLTRELTPRAIEVWNSMLGLVLERSDETDATVAAGHRRWLGCIALSGEWRGAVTVSCIDPLARIVTGAMFGIEPADATDAEIQDAVGELANILGGQTKQVLGDRCVLGLPVVIEGDSFESSVPGSRAVVTLLFRCESHPMEVSVVGANGRPVHRDGHRVTESERNAS